MSNQKMKELLESLFQIWEDEDFAIEIINVLKENMHIADNFLDFLNNETALVPSEVYDKLTILTAGEFVKEFPTIRHAKKACIDCTEQFKWEKLFTELSKAELFMVCEWKLSEEEEKLILNADIGDTLHIKSPVEPLLLMDNTKNVPIVPVYTSTYEIPSEYRKRDFVIRSVDWKYVQVTFNACKKVMKDALIILDIDSDDYLEIDSAKVANYL